MWCVRWMGHHAEYILVLTESLLPFPACPSHLLRCQAFAFFTACNIGPRAYQHHQWYLAKFGSDYPRERKAVIPFLV